MYLANSNTHSKRSSTLIAAVKDYPISKSCSVVNLYLQKEEHKSVKFVEYSVTGILIVFITWFQRSFCITHDSWCAKNSIKRIFTRNLFISLAFPMSIKHFLKVWGNWQRMCSLWIGIEIKLHCKFQNLFVHIYVQQLIAEKRLLKF